MASNHTFFLPLSLAKPLTILMQLFTILQVIFLSIHLNDASYNAAFFIGHNMIRFPVYHENYKRLTHSP